ncbi:hypothetical protein BGW80DRAFT_1417533 [Lactifluus volemus]|nr:hypothetical protein BGW80DRAFT_1417533 [Lactifluus volemus]
MCCIADTAIQVLLKPSPKELEKICEEDGLRNDSIVVRMTGYPNGCTRPGPSHPCSLHEQYDSRVSRGRVCWGSLIQVAFTSFTFTQSPFLSMIKRYPLERLDGEHIGDFVIRAGYISATTDGQAWDEGIRGEGPYHEIPA